MADDHEDADRPVEAASPGVADSAAGQTAQPAEVSDADAEVTGASGTDRHPMFALSTRNSFTIGLIGTLGVLVALVIGGMISSSMVVLTYVAAGLFIALGLEPIIRGLARWHVPRPAAIVIVFGGLVIIMTALLIVMIPAVANQVQQLAGNVPNLVDIVSQQRWFAIVNARFSGSFSEMLANATKFLSDPDSLMNVAGGVLSVSANIANGIGGAIIILVLTLYFMASLNGIKRGLVRFAPASRRDRVTELSTRIFDNVGKYVISQVAIALINAVCVYIMMAILQIGFREVLAVIVFLLALLPLIGSVAAGAVVVAVTLITQTLASPDRINLWPAIIIAIYYIVYMQFEAYVLTPRIVNRVIPLPGAIVVIAALVGGTLMGVFGALLAIPVAASLLTLIQELWIPRQDRR